LYNAHISPRTQETMTTIMTDVKSRGDVHPYCPSINRLGKVSIQQY